MALIPMTDASAQLKQLIHRQGKVLSVLKLQFTNGVVWEFEIARAHRIPAH